jgi:arabinogalactan oligomer / maltooligosaccharide transport system substrate-binding protein
MPFGLYPQLACFDRRRIASSPETVEALIAASAGGMRVGMPIDMVNLGWSLGGLGIRDDLLRISRGEKVTADSRLSISRWLDWLGNASSLHRFTFFSTSVEPLNLLGEGKLDWVPCRSHQIARIEKRLGEHLGVAPLPGGDEGPASPYITTMVLSFGTSSSRRQHEAAKAFATFAINPQRQRNATLRSLTVLPVNRTVKVPTASSSFLEAMQQSLLDSLTYGQEEGTTIDSTPDQAAINQALERMDLVLTRYLLGDLEREAATDAMISVLQEGMAR